MPATARGRRKGNIQIATLAIVWLAAVAIAATLSALNSPPPWVLGVGTAVGAVGSALSVRVNALLEQARDLPPTGTASFTIRQLPPVVAHFTGREALLREVRELALLRPLWPWLVTRKHDRSRATKTNVLTLWGRGGVGKTALAIQLGHSLAPLFPDGQIYVDLRGAPGSVPRSPADVLAMMLRDLGTDAASIPEGLDDQARMFRSRTSGLRLLIILDNAQSEDQVRYLLPGTATTMTIVTSRSQLPGLDGSVPLEVRVLEHDQAIALLGKLAGERRVETDAEAAVEIVRSCGLLPLAVRIAGARLAARPGWSLAHFARRLADQNQRLGELQAGSLDVRASISLGVDAQTPTVRRALLLLALCDAPSFSTRPLQAALNTTAQNAEQTMEELTEAQLLEAMGHDVFGEARYRFHDLVRDYAAERLVTEVPEHDRRAALDRIVGFCLHQAGQIERLLLPGSHRPPRRTALWVPPGADDEEAAAEDVLARFATEYEFHMCVVREALAVGATVPAAELASKVVTYQDSRALWNEWENLQVPVLEACRRDGDEMSEAVTLADLALLRRLQGRLEQAERDGRRALVIFSQAGEHAATASCLSDLGWLHRVRGEHEQARTHLRQALAVADEYEVPRTRGWSLQMLADLEIDGENPRAALELLELSRETLEAIGDHRGLAWTFRIMGDAYREQGDDDRALRQYMMSSNLMEKFGDRRGMARNLGAIGALHQRMSRPEQALECYSESLDIFRDLGDRQWQVRILKTLVELHEKAGQTELAEARWAEVEVLIRSLNGATQGSLPARRL
ncbi:tetratricopeptide repeat protein [Streptomyces sp. 4N509B]|uniref:tetratricopeptide repeat protein n=1 Tax=Streptomyces sp. 4N509B TaxID=3457413 RepID=UPI003FD0FD39